ncbi:MAG TPA: helix-turn-helix domain-containing protein [Candidatus Nanopelagicaceae bacterium]|nr:helix-turn-helix domain-containing protein [Candidatus Nanopelagicaceae bacterium]
MPRLLSHQRNPLGRTVRLLGWMADHDADDFGVRELAAAVGMAPSTVHRSLGALEEEGLVDSLPASGRYRLSLGFYRLALRGAARAPVVELALPFLRVAAHTGGETALLALYGAPELAVMYVTEIPARHALQVRPALHEWIPLTACAAGLAILSGLDSETLITAFGRERAAVKASELAEQLAVVRDRGFATLPGRPGNFGIEMAAPFAGPATQILGAVVFAVPERRFNPVLESSLGQLLVDQAKLISAALAG